MNYPPETTFNGIHLLITLCALLLGGFLGTAYGFIRGYEHGCRRSRR